MKPVSKQLDQTLARLAWSLWTEIGVAGLERKHQAFSIAPEELIILTSALSKFDPRLRDEALDWCISYHHFISNIRLQILAKKHQDYIAETFSTFSETFNASTDSRTKWVVLKKSTPLKFRPSGKSTLRNFENSSMINFRLRSLLGVSARADILAFLLTADLGNFTASDLLETGYSKRRLADILDNFSSAGILSKLQVRNQLRYAFVRRDQCIKLLGGIPEKMVCWDQILEILLPIRACLQEVEETPIGVRVIDMHNLLTKLSPQLLSLKLAPPQLQSNFESYWNSITKWILEWTDLLAKGQNEKLS